MGKESGQGFTTTLNSGTEQALLLQAVECKMGIVLVDMVV